MIHPPELTAPVSVCSQWLHSSPNRESLEGGLPIWSLKGAGPLRTILSRGWKESESMRWRTGLQAHCHHHWSACRDLGPLLQESGKPVSWEAQVPDRRAAQGSHSGGICKPHRGSKKSGSSLESGEMLQLCHSFLGSNFMAKNSSQGCFCWWGYLAGLEAAFSAHLCNN